MLFSFSLLLTFWFFCISIAVDYVPCPRKAGPEIRELFVATCDTRSGWKEFQALKGWNVTGYDLNKREHLGMRNVCIGRNYDGWLDGCLEDDENKAFLKLDEVVTGSLISTHSKYPSSPSSSAFTRAGIVSLM